MSLIAVVAGFCLSSHHIVTIATDFPVLPDIGPICIGNLFSGRA